MNAPIDINGLMLTTERLFLRPFRPTDLEDLYAYASVDGVGQMAGWLPHKTKEDSEKILNDFIEGKKTFAVTRCGKVIGSVGIENYDEEMYPEFRDKKVRMLGFVLAKDHWGKGLMAEACKEVIRWLFEETELDALLCGYFVRNTQSARVQEKLGFRPYKAGEYHTYYGTTEAIMDNIMTREDWEKNGRDWETEITRVVPKDYKSVMYLNDVVYAEYGDIKLKLQILTTFAFPPRRDKRPCMVFVPGSAWAPQNTHGSVPDLAEYVRRGFVVAIVEYRDFTRGVFPAPVVDARNAVRFLRINAEKYGIDPERIVMTGNSSGGHTAVYAGILHDDNEDTNLYPGVSGEVRGIVNFYGSSDFMFDNSNPITLNHNRADSPEGKEMGGVDLVEHPELAEKLTVMCQIHEDTDIAPTLILHGTRDFVVNRYCSIRMYERLKACGKDAEIALIRGAGHGGPEFYSEEILDLVCGFMRRVCE